MPEDGVTIALDSFLRGQLVSFYTASNNSRPTVHGLTKMERPFSLNGTLLFEYGTIRHPEVLLKRNDHRTKSEHRSLKTERA